MFRANRQIDMCNGPLTGKILLFAIPLILSSLLQLLFNAADMIVVGRFSGSEALAAVGSTGATCNLLVNLFMGLSVGANVVVAQGIGAQDFRLINRTIHTAILASLVGGFLLIFVGFFLSRPLLLLMGTPDDVIDLAVLYMQIYFMGMPVIMVYNFGSAILRAMGDTTRPLYFLAIAGILNIILNLVFVIIFKMSVAGVALATVISQVVSASLVVRSLTLLDGPYQLDIRHMFIDRASLKEMLRIGLPAGVQGTVFSVSNMLIQSSVNSFGSLVMAGNTASSNIEGFIYVAMNGLHQTALSFTGQNTGARNFKRVLRVLWICLGLVSGIGLGLGLLARALGTTLLSFYATDPEVIEYGLIRLGIFGVTYFTCGIMEIFVGCLRGIGAAVVPTIVSLMGACGLRVLWIYTIFQQYRSLEMLYYSYPVSWLITASVHAICFCYLFRKLKKRAEAEKGLETAV